jgi:uncharacterized repeat protein (TIGR01451 family)
VAGKITWTFDLGGFSSKTFTYKVDVTADFGITELKNTAQWRELSASTTHPVKAVKVTVGSICEADAPFYSIKVESQNLTNLPVKVEWLQANDDGTLKLVNGQPVPATDAKPGSPTFGQPLVDNYTLTGNLLDLPKLLWKGAELDLTTGKIVKWPGWLLNPDGSWTQIDDGGVRPAAILRITVNPTVDSAALYPPATPNCNANPPAVLGLDKSSPTEGLDAAPGSEIAYQVVLTNKGGQAVTDNLVDTLPDGVTYVAGSAKRDGVAAEPTVAGQSLTWPGVTVGIDDPLTTGVNEGTTTFTYRVTVDLDVPGESELENVAAWSGLQDRTDHVTPPVAPIEDEESEEVVAGEEIADTGADNVGTLVATAILAMVLGGLMVTFDRRRRRGEG